MRVCDKYLGGKSKVLSEYEDDNPISLCHCIPMIKEKIDHASKVLLSLNISRHYFIEYCRIPVIQ